MQIRPHDWFWSSKNFSRWSIAKSYSLRDRKFQASADLQNFLFVEFSRHGKCCKFLTHDTLLVFMFVWKCSQYDEVKTITKARNQEYFRAGEVSWNKGTLIKILSIKHQRKVSQGKILEFFSPRCSKNWISNETFNP